MIITSLYNRKNKPKIKKKFEDTKGVIRSVNQRTGNYYNGQKKKDNTASNDLQNTTQKLKFEQH